MKILESLRRPWPALLVLSAVFQLLGSVQAQNLNIDNFAALCLGNSGSPGAAANVGREYSLAGDTAAFPFSIQVQRKRCPADSQRIFLNVSMQPAGGALLFQILPKVTVFQDGRELGWFGTEALAGRGNQTSVALPDRDFQWWWSGCNFDCSNLYSSTAVSAPLRPRTHVDMDATRRLVLRADMTGYGTYQGRAATIELPALIDEVRPLRGMWMDPAEPGWGLFIDPGDSGAWFATWYTYAEDQRPIWMVMLNGRRSGQTVRGDLYLPRAQDGFDAGYDPARLSIGQPVGELVIRLANDLPQGFDFTLGGASGSKKLQPLILRDRSGAECNADNGVWWSPAKSGMAVMLHGSADRSREGCYLHAIWATYDEGGNPTWYFSGLGPQTTGTGLPAYLGDLFSTRGSPFTSAGPVALATRAEGSWTMQRESDGLRQRHVLRKGDREQVLTLERFRF